MFDVTRILSLRLIECHGIVSIVSVFNRVLYKALSLYLIEYCKYCQCGGKSIANIVNVFDRVL